MSTDEVVVDFLKTYNSCLVIGTTRLSENVLQHTATNCERQFHLVASFQQNIDEGEDLLISMVRLFQFCKDGN